jgi:hypothetical protein
MRFFMFTTVAASVAVAIAVPALDNRQARVCNSRLYSQPVCCSTNIVGVAAVDCAPREFSLRLRIKRDRSFKLRYL